MTRERLKTHAAENTSKPLDPAEEFIVHVMRTLDLGVAEDDLSQSPKEPGNNDPTYRTAAFSHGVHLAMEPITEAYRTQQTDKELKNIFNHTFRLSFHYSAGSPLLQSLFQLRIARILQEKYGEQPMLDAVETSVFDANNFTIPLKHVSGKPVQRADKRVPAIWEFYMQIIKNVDDIKNIPPLDRMGAKQIDDLRVFGSESFIALGIPFFMLNREISYLKQGRPNKTDYAKTFRSDIREHAIEEKLTGNDEFDVIFAEMSLVLNTLRKLNLSEIPDFYLMTGIKQQLDELERLWTMRHGVSFKSSEAGAAV